MTDSEIVDEIVTYLEEQIASSAGLRERGRRAGYSGAMMVRDAERDTERAQRILRIIERGRR